MEKPAKKLLILLNIAELILARRNLNGEKKKIWQRKQRRLKK